MTKRTISNPPERASSRNTYRVREEIRACRSRAIIRRANTETSNK